MDSTAAAEEGPKIRGHYSFARIGKYFPREKKGVGIERQQSS